VALTDLDAIGNTTKAITKGIAIAPTVLAATALFGSFRASVESALTGVAPRSVSLDVVQPNVLAGVIIGGGGGLPVRQPADHGGIDSGLHSLVPYLGIGTRRMGIGRYHPSVSSLASSSSNRVIPYSSMAARVILSTPGAPLLLRTMTHAP
jgi:hypothetical protein